MLEAEEPPGFGPPIHVHHDCAEAFYVLEGEYTMYLEDREFVCSAGSFIFIPQGARHAFRVGNTPSRKLNSYFPASMIGYFDDLSAALRREDVSDDDLAEIAAAHAMEIAGPRRSGTSELLSSLPRSSLLPVETCPEATASTRGTGLPLALLSSARVGGR